MLSTEECRKIAYRAHEGQRYSEFPHMYHVERVVANVVKWYPIAEDYLFITLDGLKSAAYLHDVVEDSEVTLQDLGELGVSSTIIEIVDCVTDGTEGNRSARKQIAYDKTQKSDLRLEATFVKLCDRIANVEFSIEEGKGMQQMYRKEHPKFKEALYYHDTKEFCKPKDVLMQLYPEPIVVCMLQPMWKRLDELLK